MVQPNQVMCAVQNACMYQYRFFFVVVERTAYCRCVQHTGVWGF